MDIFNRIINISMYLLVFLLPLFFLPFSFEAIEYNKQFLLFFIASLSFFCWLAKMALIDKELRFKRTPLDFFILGFLAIGILSAIFSADTTPSIYGFYGRFAGGLVSLLSFGLLYFVITNNMEVKRIPSLLKAFLCSSFVIVVLTYLAIFGVLAKLTFLPEVMRQIIFNTTSASLEGLSVFLAVVISLLVGLILTKTNKETGKKVFRWILLIASLGLIVLIDFTGAWLALLVTLALLVVISLWKRFFRDNVNLLLLPMCLIIISAVCIPFGANQIIVNLPAEQTLSQNVSWEVAMKSAIDSPKNIFFGSGLGTFHYDFAKEKPLSFNNNWLWQIRFDRGGSYFAELLATMGFLGILSYLSLIGIFLMMSYFLLQKARDNLPLLLIFVVLLAAQIFYYQNIILGALFWMVLALSVVNWQKPIKEKAISFKEFPELSLVLSTIVLIIGVTILGLYFYATKFYLADVNYTKAQRMQFGIERIAMLESAVRLNPSIPQYRTVLARAYMNEALTEMTKPSGEQDVDKIKILVATAINQARVATEINPNGVASWETLGVVYREIRTMASGATEWGVKSFEEAIKLEPTNPVVYTELGKLYVLTNNTEKAREQFVIAIEKKADYADALIQEVLLMEKEGNNTGAISKMEVLVGNDPFNLEFLFQLGRLYFNNNQTTLAISQFERIVLLSPNHSNARYSLGVAYVAQNKTSLAIEQFEKVLELNPGNQDVIQKLEQLR